jgi:uncharacterized UPF0146 family protein
MGRHKHIEGFIGEYIAKNYRKVAEVGVGRNFEAAWIIRNAGRLIFCTDIQSVDEGLWPYVIVDDIFSPDLALYSGLDLIYSIRPAEEMIPPMISLARAVDCDLLVYHLGFEGYGDGGEIIECGVTLHRYYARSEPVK